MKKSALKKRCQNLVKKEVIQVFLKLNEDYQDYPTDREFRKNIRESLHSELLDQLLQFVEDCCDSNVLQVEDKVGWVEEDEACRALFGILGGYLPKSQRTLYYPKEMHIAKGIQRLLEVLGYHSYKVGDEVIMTKHVIRPA